ncbi:biotin/lipoyl-containing protein, partial [Denitromonas sp.]
MSRLIDVNVPDIGDYNDVPVIELLVQVGDTVAADDAIVTLESDKATMDVPSPQAGVVRELLVKVGDRVSEGSALARIEATDAAGA